MSPIADAAPPAPADATQDGPAPPCLFCGEPEQVEVFEIWDHELMIETCCEGLHETVVREMAADPE